MNSESLRKGTKIKWNGHKYEIEKRSDAGELQLRSISNNEIRLFGEKELIAALFEGKLEIIGVDNNYHRLKEQLTKRRVFDFTALDETDKRKTIARRKLAYVKALLETGLTECPNLLIKGIIQKVGLQISDPTPPSSRSVRRWLNEFVKSGEDIRVLVPAQRAQGNRKRKINTVSLFSDSVLEIIENAINEIYLTRQRQPVQAVYDRVVLEINRVNQFRPQNDRLQVPHRSTI